MKPEDLLPQPPWIGPPLPRSLDLPLIDFPLIPDIVSPGWPRSPKDKYLYDALEVYERVAKEQPVNDVELKNTISNLAYALRESINEAEKDEDEIYEEETIGYARRILAGLEQARSRSEMVIALDSFWGYFHDNLTNVLAAFKIPVTKSEEKRILARLDKLAG